MRGGGNETMKRQSNAYIVELRGRFAAALTEDGRFIRVRNRGFEIGQTVRIELPEQGEPIRRPVKRRVRAGALASMAAGFLLLLLGGFAGYRTPVGVVSLDVNPSIEYTINCFDRVLKMEAVNEDAETILNQIDEDALLYQPVDTAIEQTIVTLRSNGYFAEETENDVVLSASSYSAAHAERLAERLAERAEKQKDLTVVSISVSKSDVEEAHALGTSAGKLYLVEQLQKSSDESAAFDTEDWIEKPVREIMKKTLEQQDLNMPQGTGDEAAGGGQGEPSGGPKATLDASPEPSGSPDLSGQDAKTQPQESPDPQNSPKGNPTGGAKPGSGGQPRG